MKALHPRNKWALRFQLFASAWFLMALGVGGCFAQDPASTDRAADLAAAKTLIMCFSPTGNTPRPTWMRLLYSLDLESQLPNSIMTITPVWMFVARLSRC